MDEMLIMNWNSRVEPGDTIYHLGDFAFADEERLCQIIKRLNGTKIFIKGNHDKQLMRSAKAKALFSKVCDYHELTIPDPEAERGSQTVVLCHYPMITWNKAHHGSIMLHGHCHGNLRYPFKGKIMDVGVDPNNYFPISYEEVRIKMRSVTSEYLDHHVGD
jgi:calcineurin-like phosphoesterase family protein